VAKKLSLSRQFWAWVGGGLIVTTILLYGLAGRCEDSRLLSGKSFLCDLKITDVAIAFFSYCLAVIGWFTIRSNEQTVRTLERAFIAVGPTKIQTSHSPPPNVSLKLVVDNTGRTAATIFEVCGEFSRSPPSGNVPVYSGRVDLTDLSIPGGKEEVVVPFNFEDGYLGNQFFWGYLRYRDIFKNVHTARFCVALVPAAPGSVGKYSIAGSDAWRECD
jgi:hypothetical protein